MLKKYLDVFLLISFLTLTLTLGLGCVSEVFAQETTATPTTTLKQDRMTIDENKKALKDSIKQIKIDTRQAIVQKRLEMQQEMQAKKQEFTQKLQTIKDQRKQTIVSNFNTKLSTVNKNQTDRMVAAIEKLNARMTKLSQKIITAQQAGKNTYAAQAAIASAQSAITVAQSAITNQAGKDYTITITTETNLRPNLGTSMNQLRSDLQAVQKTLVDARQAITAAIMEVEKLNAVSVPTIQPTAVPVISVTVTATP